MMKRFLKDLPIYLNGFAVIMLFYSIPKVDIIDIIMFILSMISFLWYIKIENK
jgi:hypothetical protein